MKKLTVSLLSFTLLFFCVSSFSQNNQKSDDLHKELNDGNTEKVMKMIEEDLSLLNEPNPRGSTPLIVAASDGEIELLKFLIKKGADINKANTFGNTPLHYAAWKANLEIFQYLIKKGAKVNIENSKGQTALQYSCMGGNIEIMNICISEGMDIQSKYKDGSSLIHWAAYGGNLEMFKLLESKGLPYNAEDKDNSSTVYWAASGNAIDVMKYLIEEKDMDVNEVDDLKNIPLKSAIERGSYEVVKYLIDHGADLKYKLKDNSTWVILASENNKPELVKLLIDKGCGINVFDDFGNTPLTTAAAHGHLELVKLLVENGAKLEPGICKRESCTSRGLSPLHCASWHYPDVAEYLIEKGSDVNKKDLDGNAALHHAVWNSNSKIIDLLCENGAETDIQNNLGETPLIRMVSKNKSELIKAILKYKANVTITDKKGKTALHYAAIDGYNEINDLLIKHNADIHAEDNKGRTPAFYAVYYGNKKIAENFFKAGASKENMPYKKAKLLHKEIAEGEAIIWYLNHSGWALKTKNNFIVFDYWQRNDVPDIVSLNNGRINPKEIADLNVTVFSSHVHRDHYSPEIFEWSKNIENINYVLGFETNDYDDYLYIPPRGEKTVGNINVTAIYSTDSGEGFMIEADGLTIYHPGDHANRYQTGDKEFTDEIDFLAEKYSSVDIAFVPITGCSFRDKKALVKGNNYVVEKFNPSMVLPMHGSSNEHKYEEYAKDRDNPIYKFVRFKGDRLYYKKDNI